MKPTGKPKFWTFGVVVGLFLLVAGIAQGSSAEFCFQLSGICSLSIAVVFYALLFTSIRRRADPRAATYYVAILWLLALSLAFSLCSGIGKYSVRLDEFNDSGTTVETFHKAPLLQQSK